MCGGTFVLGIVSTLVAGAFVMFFVLGSNKR
jgi:hypothetical protein